MDTKQPFLHNIIKTNNFTVYLTHYADSQKIYLWVDFNKFNGVWLSTATTFDKVINGSIKQCAKQVNNPKNNFLWNDVSASLKKLSNS